MKWERKKLCIAQSVFHSAFCDLPSALSLPLAPCRLPLLLPLRRLRKTGCWDDFVNQVGLQAIFGGRGELCARAQILFPIFRERVEVADRGRDGGSVWRGKTQRAGGDERAQKTRVYADLSVGEYLSGRLARPSDTGTGQKEETRHIQRSLGDQVDMDALFEKDEAEGREMGAESLVLHGKIEQMKSDMLRRLCARENGPEHAQGVFEVVGVFILPKTAQGEDVPVLEDADRLLVGFVHFLNAYW